MQPKLSYTIWPLGDSAIQVSFGNTIDKKINQQVAALALYFKEHPFIGQIDIVPAYSNITFCFDVFRIRSFVRINGTVYDWVKAQLENGLHIIMEKNHEDFSAAEQIRVPVCYDDSLGNDLVLISKKLKTTRDELIRLHTSKTYFIYMLGFLPGFAYMGELDDALAYPRRAIPQKVKAGSIGIAGKQTGIYPLNSFGGWHILGHTTVKPFDIKNEDPCYFKTGQEVTFYSIDKDEYEDEIARSKKVLKK